MCECSGAVINKVASVKYLAGEFMETNKNWQEEWFYIPDIGLEDPPRASIVTTFTPTPPTRRHSWKPKSSVLQESAMVTELAEKIARLSAEGLTLVDVMLVALSCGIQPLKDRVHPMWEYNGVDDGTRTIRGGYYEGKPLTLADVQGQVIQIPQ